MRIRKRRPRRARAQIRAEHCCKQNEHGAAPAEASRRRPNRPSTRCGAYVDTTSIRKHRLFRVSGEQLPTVFSDYPMTNRSAAYVPPFDMVASMRTRHFPELSAKSGRPGAPTRSGERAGLRVGISSSETRKRIVVPPFVGGGFRRRLELHQLQRIHVGDEW